MINVHKLPSPTPPWVKSFSGHMKRQKRDRETAKELPMLELSQAREQMGEQRNLPGRLLYSHLITVTTAKSPG